MITLTGLQVAQTIETGTDAPLQWAEGFAQTTHETLGLQQIIYLGVIHQAPLIAVVFLLDLWTLAQRQVLTETCHYLLDGLTTMGTTDSPQLIASFGIPIGKRLQTLLTQRQLQCLQQFAQSVRQLRAYNAAQCLTDSSGDRSWHGEGKPPARMNVLFGL